MLKAAVLAALVPLTLSHTASASVADGDTKDGASAIAIAVVGTGASSGGLALAVNQKDSTLGAISGVSLFFAPSYGHWYAHDSDLLPIGLRAGAVAVFVVGFSNGLAGGDGGGAEIGALGVLGVSLYDIGSSAGAVDDYNADHAIKVHVAPAVIHNGAHQQLRLGIGGSF